MKESTEGPKRPETPPAVRKDMEENYAWLKILRGEYTDDPEWQHINQKTKSPKEIAERIVILASFFPIQHTSDEGERHKKLAKIKREYWFKLTPSEQEIITNGGFDYHEEMVAGIFPHIIYMMLWCINEVDEIALTDRLEYYPELYPRLLDFVENPEKLTESPTIRRTDELLDAMVETYRLYMLSKFAFDAEADETPENANFLFIAARYMALLWVLEGGPWDEVLYELYEDSFMTNGREEDGDYTAWDEENADDIDWDDPNVKRISGEYVGIYLDEDGNVNILGGEDDSEESH